MLHNGIRYTLALLALTLFVGCPAQEDGVKYSDAEANTDTHGHDHDHGHHDGPHGGHVIELTDDHTVHAELTFDKAGPKITVYILGEDVETPLPVAIDAVHLDLEGDGDEEIEVALTPAPLEGEADGTSSVFVAEGDQVPAGIDDIEKIHGHLHVTVDGNELEGDIEHDHDHDEHDHEGHDDDHDHKK